VWAERGAERGAELGTDMGLILDVHFRRGVTPKYNCYHVSRASLPTPGLIYNAAAASPTWYYYNVIMGQLKARKII
jgi:hypothetical protein